MVTESQVLDILRHPLDREWSIQGFGMLRTYLDDGQVERLHIWNTDQAVENVSSVHDHLWDFTSRIFLGHMVNQRFVDDPASPVVWTGQKLVPGEGGHLVGAPYEVKLSPAWPESLDPGSEYDMEAPEIHESLPLPGTVSVIRRTFHAERVVATTIWRDDGDWVSAEPRPATREEILAFVDLAWRTRS